MKNIYAIRDNLAATIVGGLFLHAHHAPAVRFFSDVASDPNTNVARHIEDHDMVCLGTLDEETCELVSTPLAVVITGTAWKAAQQTPTEP